MPREAEVTFFTGKRNAASNRTRHGGASLLGLIGRGAMQQTGFGQGGLMPESLDVFVYGSLLRGEKHHGLLQEATLIGPGRTLPAYRLVDLGPYPGMVAEGTRAVMGEVYRVPGRLMAQLDRFEEHPETYVRSAVRLSDGRQVVAYLLRPPLAAGHPEIKSGDWRGYLRSRG